mgnify:CR=1 FL=1
MPPEQLGNDLQSMPDISSVMQYHPLEVLGVGFAYRRDLISGQTQPFRKLELSRVRFYELPQDRFELVHGRVDFREGEPSLLKTGLKEHQRLTDVPLLGVHFFQNFVHERTPTHKQ